MEPGPILHPNPAGRPYPCWMDGDGVVWEFNYIVTQLEEEGPEYRPFWNGVGKPSRWVKVAELDVLPFVDRALEKYFCG